MVNSWSDALMGVNLPNCEGKQDKAMEADWVGHLRQQVDSGYPPLFYIHLNVLSHHAFLLHTFSSASFSFSNPRIGRSRD